MEFEDVSGMEIIYELKNADYVDSSALAARNKRAVFILDVFIAGSFFIACLLCCGFGYFLVGASLAIAGWVYMMKRIYCWKTVRLPKERQQEQDAITLRLSERGVEYQNIADTLRMEWAEFNHLIEDDYRFLLVFQGQKAFFIIPKRAFASEQQLDEARRYFGNMANTASAASESLHPPIAKPH